LTANSVVERQMMDFGLSYSTGMEHINMRDDSLSLNKYEQELKAYLSK